MVITIMSNVVKTIPFLPPMTGNGLFIPPIKMGMTWGYFLFYHIIEYIVVIIL